MFLDPKDTNKKNTDTPLISEQNTEAGGNSNENQGEDKEEKGTNHEDRYIKGNPDVDIL